MPRKRRKPVRIEDYPELTQVVGVSEAAKLACIHPRTLRNAIDVGRVAAVKVDRFWLVSLRSLKQAYPSTSPLNI
jgi:hypothetical protein